ncbi:MAG TPA: glycoside hydrolase family 25 protein [bacterium]|jgi:lysozyme
MPDRSEPYITRLMQLGLISEGFLIPDTVAFGKWGPTSQEAYDKFIDSLSAGGVTGVANAVVMLSQFDKEVDFDEVRQDGIVGIVHRAAQGHSSIDEEYRSRKEEAHKRNLLWGAYHFGMRGDGVEQARYFLKYVMPDPGDLLVLAHYEIDNYPEMTLKEAEDFVATIHGETGRWPVLYSKYDFIRRMIAPDPKSALKNCPLWFSRYGEFAMPEGLWEDWTLWNYTDGTEGDEPRFVFGIGNCSRSKFNGNVESLKGFWESLK